MNQKLNFKVEHVTGIPPAVKRKTEFYESAYAVVCAGAAAVWKNTPEERLRRLASRIEDPAYNKILIQGMNGNLAIVSRP